MALTALSIARARIAKLRVGCTVLGAAPGAVGAPVMSSSAWFHSMAALSCVAAVGLGSAAGPIAGAAIPDPVAARTPAPVIAIAAAASAAMEALRMVVFPFRKRGRDIDGNRRIRLPRGVNRWFLSCSLICRVVTPQMTGNARPV